MRKLSLFLSAIFLAIALTGCAGARKAMVSPAVGEWDYSIQTPDGNYSGVLTILGTPEELTGSFYSNDDGGTLALENVMFADPDFTCEFVHPQFGRLSVKTTLEEEALDGTIAVPGYGEMPLKATRKEASN